MSPKSRRFESETLHVETPFIKIDLKVVLKVRIKNQAVDALLWLQTDGTNKPLLKDNIF